MRSIAQKTLLTSSKIKIIMNLVKTNKKGAIELSMTTIIVIVIGVTLLILGLTWVRGLFEKVGGLTDQSFIAAEKLIQEQMGSNEKFYISGFTFDIAGGESFKSYIGIQNFGELGTGNQFTIEVVPGEGADASWFTIPDPGMINVGGKKGVPVIIAVPRGIEPGKAFTFNINVLKDGQPYDGQPIIVRVK